nr:cysteine-rich with EGF-like domain protein 2 [Helicoverpa armigera]
MGIFEIPRIFFLMLLLFCVFISSKKLNLRDSKYSRDSKELNECRRCKVLTDSFNTWLEKTSRGKYEGGDTAWEEAKLKSYARSEVRLVEIQEGLCSELKIHQDACYAIAEESEQVLEKWWFNKDSVSLDLYTWLCIDNLQHCCPSKHYGEACEPCLQDEHNNVCAGHGRCDGAGTRKGNGTCICKKGYTGKLCDECAESFYQTSTGSCEVCHKACDGCSGEGAAACDSCNPGWEMQSGVCIDIDECVDAVCEGHYYCSNTEGSYKCNECDLSCKTCAGEGSSNCTSCESASVLWFGMCIDNELKQNILTSTYKRIAMYVGLLIITIFISHTSRSIASIVVLIIAILMYFLERNLKMNTLDVVTQTLNENFK